MGIHLSKALWRAGLAVALVTAALMALPFAARAQTGGSVTASLSSNNGVSVTISGVGAGSVFNIFACTAVTNAPNAPLCQIASTQLTANSSGQASGTVRFDVSQYAIVEIFAQNSANTGEQYSFTFSGATSPAAYSYSTPAYPTTASTTTTATTCPAGTVTYIGSTSACSGTGTCTSFIFVNGYPACASTGTVGTCILYTFVGGVPQCISSGLATTLSCSGYQFVNGVLVCTSTGLPFGFGGSCVNVVLVNGVPTCADSGLPFVPIAGCHSYSFIGGVVVCLY